MINKYFDLVQRFGSEELTVWDTLHIAWYFILINFFYKMNQLGKKIA